jgi:DNA-directed RNA polymerase subunit M/transcription elongation factor TFIIS
MPGIRNKEVNSGIKATIDENCPKCGSEELEFTTAQLRYTSEKR